MTLERKRAAVIDVGSNTIKMLVGEKTDAGLVILLDRSLECRISEGMYSSPPAFTQSAIERATEAVEELAEAAREFSPDRMEILATSAARDATNREDFRQLVQEKTGFSLKILTGEEEASGIAEGVAQEPRLDAERPFSISDLGGGSLEWIYRGTEGEIFATSLELGAVRLMNRFVPDADGPLLPENKRRIRSHCRQLLEGSLSPIATTRETAHWGTGGAFTISRLILAAENGVSLQEQSQKIALFDIRRIEERLSALDLAERKKYPGLPATRADILPVALNIVQTLAEITGAEEFYHSFCNLRMGRLARLLSD